MKRRESPDPAEVTRLLTERYALGPADRLSVSIQDPEIALTVTLVADRDRYEFELAYLRGAPEDPWRAVVDAADALFGTFIENERTYRDLPTGDDVEHGGAFFRVRIERKLPELEREADRLLGRSGDRHSS